jgi:hypothetical protein
VAYAGLLTLTGPRRFPRNSTAYLKESIGVAPNLEDVRLPFKHTFGVGSSQSNT